jgi:transformation/transcription domain-associated protein
MRPLLTLLSFFLYQFGPKQEERMLSVFTALLQRCYKAPFIGHAEVPPTIKQEMAGVCKACMSANEGAGSGQKGSSIRDSFVTEMMPEGPVFPKTLGELIDRLKHWRNVLQAEMEEKTPSCLNLEDECRSLSELFAYNPRSVRHPTCHIA